MVPRDDGSKKIVVGSKELEWDAVLKSPRRTSEDS